MDSISSFTIYVDSNLFDIFVYNFVSVSIFKERSFSLSRQQLMTTLTQLKYKLPL